MTDIIKLLPDHVANQIAAGEVVQRPASVVKELLENAVDAGATHIKLLIKNAGKTLVQVIDDGKGMSDTDARLSFERHATSKISTADDLFSLHTKGFRGEALASIAAIAHVELKTRTEDEEVGTRIEIEGSRLKTQEITATLKGTSIAVKNLFFNIPARRNFLKSDAVELRHIIDEFHRVALAHESVSFMMYNNDGELFNLPESNKRQRIVNIFGGKTNEKLVPVLEDTEIVNIHGFIVKPEFAKKTKGEQFFFVNDRFIKHAYLNHAVTSAFDGLLPDRARASYFLYMDVDPKTIDINIHPTKTEVKFEDEHAVYTLMRAAVKHSLGQFNIAPVLDFERDTNFDTPYSYKNKEAESPRVEVDQNFNPFKTENKVSSSNFTGSHFHKNESTGWEQAFEGLDTKRSIRKSGFSHLQVEVDQETETIFEEHESRGNSGKGMDQSRGGATYQLHNKYLVSTIKSGMLVIDQHRAHQRILYEELLKNITVKESVSQQLLFPLRLDFNASEIAIFAQLKESLENTGFVIDLTEEHMVGISGIPSSIQESEVSIVLEQLLDDVQHEVPDAGFSQTDVLAKSMAKSMAVRPGESLNEASRDHLLNTLFACKEPNLSPFNKKTFITITVDELDRKFSAH
ncbi:DNA mismatch repair endonuclease MutL [Flavimarina sp. Hel_I_48]|uniref:DNA mismatch repair endonuclease MutL n=1 Tax=Flavimarina sp. Hel_I_48 TaxID=1392488 RepID=UPI0004DF5A96|nr:DNA mismatch repair endonuclease MutL [Flavimarina sp. Hel_I_48]